MTGYIADGMLGRFTRWLRMLGCDIKYMKETSDEKLLEIAKRENRILLTRDFELYKRAQAHQLDAIYVQGRTNVEKLAEFTKCCKIPLNIDPDRSRCPMCGSQIQPIEKLKVLSLVPEKTFRRYLKFWICLHCRKVYWQGSHWKKINDVLKKVKKLLRESNESKNSHQLNEGKK